MVRKTLIPVLALVAAVTFFFMYRHQRHLYLETRQANYSLVARMRELQQRNQQVSRGLEQIQEAQEAAPQLKGTFVDRRKYFRQNWSNYIHVSLNDYKTGLLGGVKDIRMVVSNGTEFSLDNVSATLSYYRANGQLFKTEHLSLDRIPAKTTRQVSAPDSRRGMKVSLRLERITSQDLNFCWSAGKKPAPGDPDPYQCAPSPAP